MSPELLEPRPNKKVDISLGLILWKPRLKRTDKYSGPITTGVSDFKEEQL